MKPLTLREFLHPDTEEKLGITENQIIFFIDQKGEQNILGAYALNDKEAKVNYTHNQVTKTTILKLSDTIYYTNIVRFKEMNSDKPKSMKLYFQTDEDIQKGVKLYSSFSIIHTEQEAMDILEKHPNIVNAVLFINQGAVVKWLKGSDPAIKGFKESNHTTPTTRQDLEIVAKHKKVKDINEQITVKLSLLKMADIATMLMLFIFMVGFYVADPFHLVTFITDGFNKNPAELFTYFVLLGFAGIMAYTIAHLKREHYHHTARHNKNVWKVGIILVIFSMTGEIYNSLGSQQHSQFSKAESSEMFKSISDTQISVNAGSGAELAQAAGKLATCKTRLSEGKEKTCATSQARVDSLKESATIAASAGATAAAAASEQKTKDMLAVVDLNVHPFYKALAEMGIPQKIAALLLAAFVAYAFERMHLTLPEDLKDLYQQKAALDADLLDLNKSNLTARNAQTSPVNVPESELGTPEITTRGKNFELPPEKSPMGFISQRGHFKYEEPEQKDISPKQNFIGFSDPNKMQKSEKGILNNPVNQGETFKTRAVSRIDQNLPVYTPRVDTAKMTRQADTASETQGICPQCGVTYELTRWNKRFCNDQCKDAWHNAQRPERERHIGKFKA